MKHLLRGADAEATQMQPDWAARGAAELLSIGRENGFSYPHTEGWARVTARIDLSPLSSVVESQPNLRFIVVASPLYVRLFPRETTV